MKGMLLDFLTTINETGVTLPSLSVLQALITSFPEQNSSKQCCLLLSVTKLFSSMGFQGLAPLAHMGTRRTPKYGTRPQVSYSFRDAPKMGN